MEILLILAILVPAIIGFAVGYLRRIAKVKRTSVPKTEDYVLAMVVGLLCAVGSVCLVAAIAFGACVCAVSRHA